MFMTLCAAVNDLEVGNATNGLQKGHHVHRRITDDIPYYLKSGVVAQISHP